MKKITDDILSNVLHLIKTGLSEQLKIQKMSFFEQMMKLTLPKKYHPE